MSDVDFDAIPDAFTREGQCFARRPVDGVIGATPHTHVCREPVDDESRHDGRHRCICGYLWGRANGQ